MESDPTIGSAAESEVVAEEDAAEKEAAAEEDAVEEERKPESKPSAA
jgi:hypothetical protein